MNEEDTRESLRRFINDWRRLIGAEPAQLSLVERLDQTDGTKLANYEQRAFRYPLRGDYGKLQIHFTPERRVLNVSSTCIPDADRVQSALAGITPRLTPADAVKHVRDKGITYTTAGENDQKFTPSANDEVTARELVIYVLPTSGSTDSLEFHLAWEIELANAPVKKAYLDAIRAEVFAAK